jgi:hypothetical protein
LAVADALPVSTMACCPETAGDAQNHRRHTIYLSTVLALPSSTSTTTGIADNEGADGEDGQENAKQIAIELAAHVKRSRPRAGEARIRAGRPSATTGMAVR